MAGFWSGGFHSSSRLRPLGEPSLVITLAPFRPVSCSNNSSGLPTAKRSSPQKRPASLPSQSLTNSARTNTHSLARYALASLATLSSPLFSLKTHKTDAHYIQINSAVGSTAPLGSPRLLLRLPFFSSGNGTTGGTTGEVLFEPTDLERSRNFSRGERGEPRGCETSDGSAAAADRTLERAAIAAATPSDVGAIVRGICESSMALLVVLLLRRR